MITESKRDIQTQLVFTFLSHFYSMNNEFHFRKDKLLDKEIVSHLRRHSTHVLDMFKNFFIIMCIIQKTKCVEVKVPSSKENSTG